MPSSHASIDDLVEPGPAGPVQHESLTFAVPPDEMILESGARLGPVTVAYETFGRLNEARSNAIMICHALSGNSHVAGDGGWWDVMVGPGKSIDTTTYFVICSNVLGGCSGSTGPSSVNPATGTPYALSFPLVTIGDMVAAQARLLDHLGIDRLLAVVGGSMGGMQALEWAISRPGRVRAAIPIATAVQLPPQGLAFDAVMRQAIVNDPRWQATGGDYYATGPPTHGLAVARMVGHITYMSKDSMREKFGRRLQDTDALAYDVGAEFQVESYLQHQGVKFTKRFDANSYLYITKAIDYFDLPRRFGSLQAAFSGVTARFLVVSFSSDWLYPPECSRQIVSALKVNGIDASYVNVESTYGHDAFLLPSMTQEHAVKHFLANVVRCGVQ